MATGTRLHHDAVSCIPPTHTPLLQPGEEYKEPVCDTNSTTGNIRGHYDPFGSGPTMRPGYDVDCGANRTSGCEVGDLTGKHDRLTISGTLS